MSNPSNQLYIIPPGQQSPQAVVNAAGRKRIQTVTELPEKTLTLVCGVFADALADVGNGIEKALLANNLTTEYNEKYVRPDMVYIILALNSIRDTKKDYKAKESPVFIGLATDSLKSALFHVDAAKELQAKLDKHFTFDESVRRREGMAECQKLIAKARGLLAACAVRER